ncbi:glycosyl transferase, UDP-glucuronosyltransferase [Saccharomonospora marina XMU15]|uniref:Glycosyl transferase, UDP-glucuronosyltransferase n=1 Tax=Saccharomonospora marina XMU15 TaxID=882083 RepID=H5XBY2_9PSEU|nr:nucleotide disphospho-sugar-binding domain-containing protein [Saccharomonospora marina]EHR52769.1 glycosyl transferase, UDP-glucuronosyltransferase [Saccharomonospora marina XMU15]
MRILFTTQPLSGHFFPLVPLAWACRLAGHEVLVATAENFVSVATRAGLPVTACGPPADFLAEAFAATRHYSLADRRYAHGQAFARASEQALPELGKLVDSWRPDVVVCERAETAGPLVAAAGGIPFAELHWGVAELREYRIAATQVLGAAGPGNALPVPDWVINPWPPTLRLPYAASHQSIRSIDYNGDTPVPDWALRGEGPPRVCVTFGTVLPEAYLDDVSGVVRTLLENLARLGLTVVVAVDEKVVADWPRLPTSVSHVGRMPLSEVMRTCVAAVHHGGQGTTLTALAANLPQLVLPVFDDQFDNAEAVERSGAGMILHPQELTAAVIGDRCHRLLSTGRYADAATRVAHEMSVQPAPSEIAAGLARLAA